MAKKQDVSRITRVGFDKLCKAVCDFDEFYDILDEELATTISFGKNDIATTYVKVPNCLIEEDCEDLKERILMLLQVYGFTYQNAHGYNRFNYNELNEMFGFKFKNKEWTELLVGAYEFIEITYKRTTQFQTIVDRKGLLNKEVAQVEDVIVVLETSNVETNEEVVGVVSKDVEFMYQANLDRRAGKELTEAQKKALKANDFLDDDDNLLF